MTIAENFIRKIRMESESTRKLFERLPAGKLAWRPHAKSMTLGQLAWHIAVNPRNISEMSKHETQEMPNFGFHEADSVEAILSEFEEGLAFAEKTLSGFSDEDMHKTITFTQDGKEIISMPRTGVIDIILISHWIHHRGQLSIYLRQLDIPLPSIYGPSADELPVFMQEATA